MKFCAFRATRQIVDPPLLSFRGISQRHEILSARSLGWVGYSSARARRHSFYSALRSRGAPAGDRPLPPSLSVRSRLGVEEQFSLV